MTNHIKSMQEIEEIIQDHYSIMENIFKTRKAELKKQLSEFDVTDYLGNLLETYYGYILLKRMSPIDPNHEFILSKTLNCCRELDSYTDTIDILTNPAEMELFERSQTG